MGDFIYTQCPDLHPDYDDDRWKEYKEGTLLLPYQQLERKWVIVMIHRDDFPTRGQWNGSFLKITYPCCTEIVVEQVRRDYATKFTKEEAQGMMNALRLLFKYNIVDMEDSTDLDTELCSVSLSGRSPNSPEEVLQEDFGNFNASRSTIPVRIVKADMMEYLRTTFRQRY